MPDEKPEQDENALSPPPSGSSPGETPPVEPAVDASTAPPGEPVDSDDPRPEWLERLRATRTPEGVPVQPEASRSPDDELPEWLLEHRRRTAADASAASPELPEWLLEHRRKKADEGAAAAKDDLPDWLSEYSQPSDAAQSPSDAAQSPSDAAQSPSDAAQSPSDAAQSPSDAAQLSDRDHSDRSPNWLRAGATAQPSGEANTDAPDDDALSSAEPDWLEGMFSLPLPPQPAEQNAPKRPSEQEPGQPALPDWLLEGAEPASATPPGPALPGTLIFSPSELDAEDIPIPEWLQESGGQEESPAGSATAAELPDWLTQTAGEPGETSERTEAPTEAEPPGLPGEPEPVEPAEERIIPAWLADMAPPGTADDLFESIKPAQEEEVYIRELDARQVAMAYWAGEEAAAAWAAEQRAKYDARQAAKRPSRRLALPQRPAAPAEASIDAAADAAAQAVEEPLAEAHAEPPAALPIGLPAPPDETDEAISEVRRALAEAEQLRPPEKPPGLIKRWTDGLGAALGLPPRPEKATGPLSRAEELDEETPSVIPLPAGETLPAGDSAEAGPPDASLALRAQDELRGVNAAGMHAASIHAGEAAEGEDLAGDAGARLLLPAPPGAAPEALPVVPPAAEIVLEKKGSGGLTRLVTGALRAGRAATDRLRGKTAPLAPEPLSEDEIERRLGLTETPAIELPGPAEPLEEDLDLRSEALDEWGASAAVPDMPATLEDAADDAFEPVEPEAEALEADASAGILAFEDLVLLDETEADETLIQDVPAEAFVESDEETQSAGFDEIRSVALEDYQPPAPEPSARLIGRRMLLRVAVIAGLMAVVTLCTCCLGVYALQGPLRAMLFAPVAALPPTPTPSLSPVPMRLVLPGGWPMDLEHGGPQNGQWIPLSAEWLIGSEINRWIALPWGKELEAVFRTIRPGDTIVLVMDNLDQHEYIVSFVQEVPRGMVAPLWVNEPTLTVVLSHATPIQPIADPLPETRWMIVAFPK